uniref:sensor histidine kinase n=1 Tax=Pedobacter sp. TaxID=1411316 RepID=UPI003D7F3F83
HTPNNKVIEIHGNEINGMVQVCVEDNGVGMKPQDQEQLFDRYFKIDYGQDSTKSGFGLGLYLAAEIIKSHGGEIWVKSELGIGSRFYFNLPKEN